MNDIITHICTALMADYRSVYYIDLKSGQYERLNREEGEQQSIGDFIIQLFQLSSLQYR